MFFGGFGPFRSQMHLVGVKLDPFRTLKVLKRWAWQVVRTHTTAYLLFRALTAHDARHFFSAVLASFRSHLHLLGDPFRTLKVQKRLALKNCFAHTLPPI